MRRDVDHNGSLEEYFYPPSAGTTTNSTLSP
jgi:hypothetical protein